MFCSAVFSVAAESIVLDEIKAGGVVTVNLPEALISFLSYHKTETPQVAVDDSEDQLKQKVGYRIQVFDDNNPRTAKDMAQERKLMIEGRFPEFRGYINFNSPYWRVKVGDFKTRSEAEAALGAIKAAFPSISGQFRVVRDKINPR